MRPGCPDRVSISMKKIVITSLILLAIPFSTLAWDDCPKGLVDAPYPGECDKYIDTDGDGICDHSQPAPKDRGTTNSEELEEIDTKETSLEDKNFEIENANLSQNSDSLETNSPAVSSSTTTKIETSETKNSPPFRSNYYLIWIVFVSLVLYLLSHALSEWKVITPLTHKRIWNVFLLVSFLLTAISGIILILRISHEININLYINKLFWHVETGIVMAVIATIHVLGHWRYFVSIFKRK